MGKASEIIEDDEGIWVLFDTTKLYYKPETLVHTTQEAVEAHEKEASAKDVKDYIKQMEEEAKSRDIGAVGQITGGG